MPLLDMQNLSLSIGDNSILKNISFGVEPGEIVGVVGESGSGKSMTLLSIMQLLPRGARTSGAVQFDGADLQAKSDRDMCAVRGKHIGMIFQEPLSALNPVQTIGRQVAEMFTLHERLTLREAMNEAAKQLAKVGLDPARVPLDRYPHQLSGGQRQRVVIAMATALAPKLVLADEPATALDVTAQAGILDLLKTLARRDGAGLIFVTHDLALVAGLADRILIMKDGTIVEECRAPKIFRNLRHPYSQALLAAATLAPSTRKAKLSHGSPIGEAKGITIDYKPGFWNFARARHATRAVDNVSLTIAPGEILGVVGESGSGKSTLARTMLGLERPTKGQIKIGGEDFIGARGKSLRKIRQRIQVVFQDPYGSLDPRLRVEAIVAEPLQLLDRRLNANEVRQKVESILDRVGLSAADAGRFPHQFSGGQRQRIAIARALILEPQLVVLDEAVSALDVSIRTQIISLLRNLSERLNLAYLFITHDLGVIRALADRVLVMQNGRIVEEGLVADVFAAPKHDYTRELIAASPDLERALAARELESARA